MSFQDTLQRIRTIAEALPEDDPDKSEMLSVEGDYPALMEWALVKRNEILAQEEAASRLIDLYSARCQSFTKRADSIKNVVAVIMAAAGERKYQGIAGTVSVKAVPPKPIVTDEARVPERFFETKRNLSKSLINEAVKNGETIPGVTLDNGGETLSIRSK